MNQVLNLHRLWLPFPGALVRVQYKYQLRDHDSSTRQKNKQYIPALYLHAKSVVHYCASLIATGGAPV